MEELIEKWRLNKSLLASKMGMPLGTFCNKLSSKHPTKFLDREIILLKSVLLELENDLDSITTVDFNEALKAIVSQ